MDLGILAGIVLIVVWAVVALGFSGPGWIHLLLTVGVFLVIWRIVVRGDRRHPRPLTRDTDAPRSRTAR